MDKHPQHECKELETHADDTTRYSKVVVPVHGTRQMVFIQYTSPVRTTVDGFLGEDSCTIEVGRRAKIDIDGDNNDESRHHQTFFTITGIHRQGNTLIAEFSEVVSSRRRDEWVSGKLALPNIEELSEAIPVPERHRGWGVTKKLGDAARGIGSACNALLGRRGQ